MTISRRRFLLAAAATPIAIALAPLASKLEWREGAGLYDGAAKVYPEAPAWLSPLRFQDWSGGYNQPLVMSHETLRRVRELAARFNDAFVNGDDGMRLWGHEIIATDPMPEGWVYELPRSSYRLIDQPFDEHEARLFHVEHKEKSQ